MSKMEQLKKNPPLNQPFMRYVQWVNSLASKWTKRCRLKPETLIYTRFEWRSVENYAKQAAANF